MKTQVIPKNHVQYMSLLWPRMHKKNVRLGVFYVVEGRLLWKALSQWGIGRRRGTRFIPGLVAFVFAGSISLCC